MFYYETGVGIMRFNKVIDVEKVVTSSSTFFTLLTIENMKFIRKSQW